MPPDAVVLLAAEYTYSIKPALNTAQIRPTENALYLDDIIVIAPDFQTHLSRLGEVLHRLQLAGLKLKPGKCELLQPKVKYLGHIVSEGGIATDPEKMSAVSEWPTPRDLPQLRAFLGTVGYYRQYIQDFATVAKPLTILTGKGVPGSGPTEVRHPLKT